MEAVFPRGEVIQRYGIYWLLLAMLVFATAFIGEFRDLGNLANVLKQSAALAVLAIGQTFVIVAGLIDLSVGMLAGLVVVTTADLMDGRSAMTIPAIMLALFVGGGIGLVNGVLNNVLRIHPLILTFGMLSVLQGAIFVYTDRSVGLVSREIEWAANGDLLGIPFSALLLLIIGGLAHSLLSRSRYGFHVYAVGGNEEGARRAGIDVDKVKLLAFVLSGLSAGIAGLLVAGRLGTGYPNAGVGLELDAIAAVVLGGATLAGGRGTIAGTVAAVFVLGLTSNILNLLEISSFVQLLIKGLIVIGAILVNQPKE
ncbi:MAG: ABC transporter permease [Alphaproteobacteria bacterium]